MIGLFLKDKSRNGTPSYNSEIMMAYYHLLDEPLYDAVESPVRHVLVQVLEDKGGGKTVAASSNVQAA
mgnify:CR=1 FL=1